MLLYPYVFRIIGRVEDYDYSHLTHFSFSLPVSFLFSNNLPWVSALDSESLIAIMLKY